MQFSVFLFLYSRLRHPRLILSLSTQRSVCMLRRQIARVVYRQLLVIRYVSECFIIESESDIKMSDTHTIMLSKCSELYSVSVVKSGIRSVELE